VSIASQAEYAWIRRLLAATLVLNLIDGILTVLLVSTGVAEEANPLMAAALRVSPAIFMAIKLGIVSAGIETLWRLRHNRLANGGAVAVFGAYVAVMGWHVQSIEAIASWLRTVG